MEVRRKAVDISVQVDHGKVGHCLSRVVTGEISYFACIQPEPVFINRSDTCHWFRDPEPIYRKMLLSCGKKSTDASCTVLFVLATANKDVRIIRSRITMPLLSSTGTTTSMM
jgi:hypothetical protein